jgi:hypothetical protein
MTHALLQSIFRELELIELNLKCEDPRKNTLIAKYLKKLHSLLRRFREVLKLEKQRMERRRCREKSNFFQKYSEEINQ